MTKETIIAVDAMGGDGGPKVIMPAIKDFLLVNNDVSIEVYGDEEEISKYISEFNQNLLKNIKIVHTLEKVLSEDSPSHALRHKKIRP